MTYTPLIQYSVFLVLITYVETNKFDFFEANACQIIEITDNIYRQFHKSRPVDKSVCDFKISKMCADCWY